MGRRHGDLQYFLVRDELLLFTSNVRETIRIPVTDDLERSWQSTEYQPHG